MSSRNGTPPHDLAAEESVLGAMLLSRDAALEGLALLRAHDFYKPAHGHVFEAVARVVASGGDVDTVTVAGELGRMGKLPAGLAGDLVGWTVNVPSVRSVTTYARDVRQCAEARALAAAGEQMRVEAMAGNVAEALAVVDRVLAEREGIGQGVGSLTPSDVGAVMLNGGAEIEPELLRRSDGGHLLLRSAVTVIHGEPGAGKTFLALEVATQAMVAEETVAVVDYEGSERTWAQRFTELGVDPAVVSKQLIYFRPGRVPPSVVARALVRAGVTVAVVDGFAAALAEHGKSENEAADALWLLRGLCRPLAVLDVAVLVLHHVVKDRANRGDGKWGRGSGAILAEVDAAFSLELVEPFARGHAGWAKLRIAKDRHGVIGPERSVAAEVVFGANADGRLHVELRPATGDPAWQGPTDCMADIVAVLEELGDELSPAKLVEKVRIVTGRRYHRTTVSEAAERLARDPEQPVTVRTGGRNARLFRHFGRPASTCLVLPPGQVADADLDDLPPPASTVPYGTGGRQVAKSGRERSNGQLGSPVPDELEELA